MMTVKELEAIEKREQAAAKGPWELRDGIHTGNVKVDEAGGIRTKVPVARIARDGTPVLSDVVALPHAVVAGDREWLAAFTKASREKKIRMSMELFMTDEDAAFVIHAREDVPKLAAEVRHLRDLLRRVVGGDPQHAIEDAVEYLKDTA